MCGHDVMYDLGWARGLDKRREIPSRIERCTSTTILCVIAASSEKARKRSTISKMWVKTAGLTLVEVIQYLAQNAIIVIHQVTDILGSGRSSSRNPSCRTERTVLVIEPSSTFASALALSSSHSSSSPPPTSLTLVPHFASTLLVGPVWMDAARFRTVPRRACQCGTTLAPRCRSTSANRFKNSICCFGDMLKGTSANTNPPSCHRQLRLTDKDRWSRQVVLKLLGEKILESN